MRIESFNFDVHWGLKVGLENLKMKWNVYEKKFTIIS